MIISKSRYSNLLCIIDAQKQIIDEYKKKKDKKPDIILKDGSKVYLG